MDRVFATLGVLVLSTILWFQPAGGGATLSRAEAPTEPGRPDRATQSGRGGPHLSQLVEFLHQAEELQPSQRAAILARAREEAVLAMQDRQLGLGSETFLARIEELGGAPGGDLLRVRSDPLRSLEFDFLFHEPDVFARYAAYVRSGAPLSDHQLWHQVSTGFFTRSRVDEYHRHVAPVLGDVRGQNWADVGAGTGFGLIFLLEVTGRAPVAQDVAPEVQEFWRFLKRRVAGLKEMRTVLGRRDACGLEPGTLDGITMNEVHMAGCVDPASRDFQERVLPWLQSVRVALRPGGRLVVTEHEPAGTTAYAAMMDVAGFRAVEVRSGGGLTLLEGRR